jgi:hypothetical protein
MDGFLFLFKIVNGTVVTLKWNLSYELNSAQVGWQLWRQLPCTAVRK